MRAMTQQGQQRQGGCRDAEAEHQQHQRAPVGLLEAERFEQAALPGRRIVEHPLVPRIVDRIPAQPQVFQSGLPCLFVNVQADWRTLVLLMLGFGIAATALTLLPLLRHRSHADPAELLYLKQCRKLEKHGCARAPHEGPRAYRMRIAAAESALPPAMRAAAIRFLELYETLRYAAPDERGRNEK